MQALMRDWAVMQEKVDALQASVMSSEEAHEALTQRVTGLEVSLSSKHAQLEAKVDDVEKQWAATEDSLTEVLQQRIGVDSGRVDSRLAQLDLQIKSLSERVLLEAAKRPGPENPLTEVAPQQALHFHRPETALPEVVPQKAMPSKKKEAFKEPPGCRPVTLQGSEADAAPAFKAPAMKAPPPARQGPPARQVPEEAPAAKPPPALAVKAPPAQIQQKVEEHPVAVPALPVPKPAPPSRQVPQAPSVDETRKPKPPPPHLQNMVAANNAVANSEASAQVGDGCLLSKAPPVHLTNPTVNPPTAPASGPPGDPCPPPMKAPPLSSPPPAVPLTNHPPAHLVVTEQAMQAPALKVKAPPLSLNTVKAPPAHLVGR